MLSTNGMQRLSVRSTMPRPPITSTFNPSLTRRVGKWHKSYINFKTPYAIKVIQQKTPNLSYSMGFIHVPRANYSLASNPPTDEKKRLPKLWEIGPKVSAFSTPQTSSKSNSLKKSKQHPNSGVTSTIPNASSNVKVGKIHETDSLYNPTRLNILDVPITYNLKTKKKPRKILLKRRSIKQPQLNTSFDQPLESNQDEAKFSESSKAEESYSSKDSNAQDEELNDFKEAFTREFNEDVYTKLRKQLKLTEDEAAEIAHLEYKDKQSLTHYLDEYDSDLLSSPFVSIQTWHGTFKDAYGESELVLNTTGTLLSMKVRGLRFEGQDLMEWSVRNDILDGDAAMMKFDLVTPEKGKMHSTEFGSAELRKQLNNFILQFTMPINIASRDESSQEVFVPATFHIQAGKNGEKVSFLKIALELENQMIVPELYGTNKQGLAISFNEQIKRIQTKLAPRYYFKHCWGCAYSEYSPMDKTPYGAMACFRDWPKIVDLTNQFEVIRNWFRHSGNFQETHVCPSFKRRTRPRIEPFNQQPI